MRFIHQFFSISLALTVCACREKPAPVLPQPTLTPAPSTVATPNPLTPTTRATPGQIGSVLRVRVVFGGLPPQDGIAALLHRDEIPSPTLARGAWRFALASFQGWQEAQLRNANTRFFVYRDKVGPGGQPEAAAFVARLAQFDAASGLGVLVYCDDFEATIDVGLRLPHGIVSRADLLLQTSHAEPIPAASRPGREEPFAVEAGVLHHPGNGRTEASWPALGTGMVADPTALAIGGSDRLIGFVETASDGQTTMTPLGAFALALRLPAPELSGVAFDDPRSPGHFRVLLTLQPSPGGESRRHVRLHLREGMMPTPGAPPAPDAAGIYAPVSDHTVELSASNASSGSLAAFLPEPMLGQTQFYLAQVSWPFFDARNSPEVYGRPFVVKVERRATGVYPSALNLGLPGADQPAGEDASASRFALEAPAMDVHLIAGGREALIHLDGAPFWKRFSFEKNDWLPLPGDLVDASVTGNLNAIFVLDRHAHELRRFRLPDLTPAGVKPLPLGNDFVALAGCNSACAPVHVLAAGDALALDPETLERRDVPWWLDHNARCPVQTKENEHYTCYSSGDGLCVWRTGEYSQPYLYYNSDARGLEYSYLGVGGNVSGVPGVTGGFHVENGVACRDTPGGKTTTQGLPPEPWTVTPAALAENAPVVFRLLHPSPQTLPPRPPRLGCFAFAGALPFAEVDVPELTDLTSYEKWNKARWAFLDPYSRSLATLSADRRTFVVRSLPAAEGPRAQPVLLNWPDTTVARGGVFRFCPRLDGGTRFTVAPPGQPPPAPTGKEAETVELPVAADEFDSVRLLNVQVPGQGDAALSYPVVLHVAGPELPFAAQPSADANALDGRGANLATIGQGHEGLVPLRTSLHRFSEPVREMYGPVAGCIVLVTATGQANFFSVAERRVVGSTMVPAKAVLYPGAGALLEYDLAAHTLTRIGIPSGQREQALDIPAGINVCGIGVGTDPGSPVTLVFDFVQGQSVQRFGGLTITRATFQHGLAVLEGVSLRANGRAQPRSFAQMLGKPDDNPDRFMGNFDFTRQGPVALPASRNGALVYTPLFFLAHSPEYAVIYPFALNGRGIDMFSAPLPFKGSLSGLMAFSFRGEAFRGGLPVKMDGAIDYNSFGSTPDGLYQFSTAPGGDPEMRFGVRLAGEKAGLLRLARFAFMDRGQWSDNTRRTSRVLMCADNGPLAVLSGSGQAIQLTDLDIAACAKTLAPDEYHVVSQPVPLAIEGTTMRYQVRVNNPEAVQFCRLAGPVPGANVSPEGLFAFTAPKLLDKPLHVTISIQIVGKKGQVVTHEFPVYVLPAPRPGTRSKGNEI